MAKTIDGLCGVVTDRNSEKIKLNANENEAFGEQFARDFMASLDVAELVA
jgi:hypothetical protein